MSVERHLKKAYFKKGMIYVFSKDPVCLHPFDVFMINTVFGSMMEACHPTFGKNPQSRFIRALNI